VDCFRDECYSFAFALITLSVQQHHEHVITQTVMTTASDIIIYIIMFLQVVENKKPSTELSGVLHKDKSQYGNGILYMPIKICTK
jgi:hypothetical protein